MWNSVISTPGARYACVDVKKFYLCTLLDRYEYMRIPVNMVPPEFMELLYNLYPMVKNGYIYMEIQRGIYGLPHKAAFWLTSYSRSAYRNMAILNYPTRPASSCTKLGLYGSL